MISRHRFLRYFSYALLAGVTSFLSCNNDDEAARPVVTLSATPLSDGIYDASEGELVSIVVSINAPQGFKVLSIGFENLSRLPEEVLPNDPGQSTFEYTFTMENWIYENETFDIVFVAVDDQNAAGEARVTVTPGSPTVELLPDNPDVDNGTVKIFVNQEFRIAVRYTFPAGFGQFRWSLTVDGVTDDALVTSLPPTQGTSVTDNRPNTFGPEFLGSDISFEFEITDKFGATAILALPATIEQKPTAIYTAVLLSAPLSDETSKSFFSSNTGLTYSVQDVSGSTENISQFIDFGYYYGVTDKASFTGPGNYPTTIYNLGPNGENWTNLNITNFRRTSMTTSEFNELNEGSLEAVNEAYDDATGAEELIITDLQVDEVIAFKTSNQKTGGSKKGLLKVVSITPGNGSTDLIEIEVIANQ